MSTILFIHFENAFLLALAVQTASRCKREDNPMVYQALTRWTLVSGVTTYCDGLLSARWQRTADSSRTNSSRHKKRAWSLPCIDSWQVQFGKNVRLTSLIALHKHTRRGIIRHFHRPNSIHTCTQISVSSNDNLVVSPLSLWVAATEPDVFPVSVVRSPQISLPSEWAPL